MGYYLEKCIAVKDSMNKKFNCFPYFQLLVSRIILSFAWRSKGLRPFLTPSVGAVTLFYLVRL